MATRIVTYTTELQTLSILAVEDDAAWTALVEELLRGESGDLNFEAVSTLADAVDSLRRRPADCVLLDLSLPDASGMTALETLARAFPALPIVVLTGNEEESNALAAVAQGAEDYLAKRGADGPTLMRSIRYARGRKAAEGALRRTTAQLIAAEELAGMGSWEWDLATDSINASRTLCTIYGLAGETFEGGLGRLHEFVHPDDRPELERTIRSAVDGDTSRFRAEYRIVRPDGEERTIEAVGDVRRSADGSPTGVLGIALDVTEQRQTAEEVVRTRERLIREHATVETLQRSLLPDRLPVIPGAELGALYRPAAPESSVGGDFYDVFRLSGSLWTLLIGDVAGKGSSAAALSALARYTVRADARREREPARVLELLNDALVGEDDGEGFCTAACATLELGNGSPRLTIASAGHPPPLLIRAGEARELTGPGDLLGYSRDVSFEERHEALEPGDTLVFYTDGLLDAHAPAQQLEPSDICRLATSMEHLPPSALASELERAVVKDGEAGRDDIAILVARITGAD